MRISEMKNIGVVNEGKLAEVGIVEPAQLRELGTEAAFLKIRHLVDDGACLNLLYGLEGAVQDIPKRELSERRKAELLDFFKQLD